jgi:hypothetical protein
VSANDEHSLHRQGNLYDLPHLLLPHRRHGCKTNLTNTYPTEFFNTIVDSSLHLHKFNLKINQPIILLRNIAQAQGLCNGTRMIVKALKGNFNQIIRQALYCSCGSIAHGLSNLFN